MKALWPLTMETGAMEHPDGYPCHTVSLANPGMTDEATNLPLLLRRAADMIEELNLNPIEILDLTVSHEMQAGGPWWSITLYWKRD